MDIRISSVGAKYQPALTKADKSGNSDGAIMTPAEIQQAAINISNDSSLGAKKYTGNSAKEAEAYLRSVLEITDAATSKNDPLLTIELNPANEYNHKPVHGAVLTSSGSIFFSKSVETRWDLIDNGATNKTISVPKNAKHIVIDVVNGDLPPMSIKIDGETTLQFNEKQSEYPDYAPGTKGKHIFNIPKELRGKDIFVLRLQFGGVGTISAGSELKIYFAK